MPSVQTPPGTWRQLRKDRAVSVIGVARPSAPRHPAFARAHGGLRHRFRLAVREWQRLRNVQVRLNLDIQISMQNRHRCDSHVFAHDNRARAFVNDYACQPVGIHRQPGAIAEDAFSSIA